MAGSIQSSSAGVSSDGTTSAPYTINDLEKSTLRGLQDEYLNFKTQLLCDKIEQYPLENGHPSELPLTEEQEDLMRQMRGHYLDLRQRFWEEFKQRCTCQNCGEAPLEGFRAHSDGMQDFHRLSDAFEPA
jgi:hypothetical protein